MRKLSIIAILYLVFGGVAAAETYVDALRQCGAEWKASDQRKAVKKGEGMAAWQAFRKECVERVGYTSKKRGQVGGAPQG